MEPDSHNQLSACGEQPNSNKRFSGSQEVKGIMVQGEMVAPPRPPMHQEAHGYKLDQAHCALSRLSSDVNL